MTTMIESKIGAFRLREADELVREPGDGVRLAAARRVLDQVALARAVRGRVGQELPHHVELVVAREDLLALLPAGLLVLRPRRSGRSSRGCRSSPRGVRIRFQR